MKGHLNIFTARKRRFGQGNVFILVCHSVHRGGDLCPRMHHRSHDSEISVQGGSLSRGSLYRGSLSRRVSVQSGGGGICPEGSLSRGSLSGRSPRQKPPCTVTSGRYASYWNAFLLKKFFTNFPQHKNANIADFVLAQSFKIIRTHEVLNHEM